MIILHISTDYIDDKKEVYICPCCETKIKQYNEIGMLRDICPMCKNKIKWEE